MAKQVPQNDDLKKRLEALGLNVKPAPNKPNSVIVTQPKPTAGKAPPQPAYVPTQTWGLGQNAAPYGVPAVVRQRQQQGNIRPAAERQRLQQNLSSRPVAGPQPQGFATPAGGRYQPPLPAAAADRLRQQYAAIQATPGSFTTDTNQGLLDVLQRMGLRPTPLNQWGEAYKRLSQMPGR